LRSVKPGGKFVAIGDQKQSIFGFTSVEENVMQTIVDRTSADTLSLTKTFRCGKAIVEHAKQYVPEYEAADTNPEGEVLERTLQEMTAPECDGGAKPGDMIISRTNAPLIPLCLSFIRESRKATVLGKDLGKNLLYMIRRSKAESVVGFLTWLDEWKNIECEKLIARNKKCDHIVDKYDTLVALTDGLRDLASVRKRIEEMFSDTDEDSIITLCTGHKSKGLERKTIWTLEETFAKCAAKAKTPFEIEQEANVRYVSATRAINTLNQVF
jgi:DNA helicase II / ATP-dependent DNA helicase PcrA